MPGRGFGSGGGRLSPHGGRKIEGAVPCGRYGPGDRQIRHGPDKIDIKLVVHGPALNLFRKETIDPGLLSGFKGIVEKGAEPEMCQVSMKLLNAPLETLAPGFEPTEHPVAVKRIADLQEQGYIYIKP